ncbi:MAG: hypothetical protein JKP92_07855, partial [Alphaproteobacteria bacterium]|nr:hypothetical protein [Alphaproteobacteria bacterium]
LPADLTDPDTPMALQFAWAVGSILLLVGALWTLRLGWLFVPAALGRPLRSYMRALAGGHSSLCLLAVWIAGTVPPFLFALILADIARLLALPGLVALAYILFVVRGVAGLVLTTMAAAVGIGAAMHKEDERWKFM